MQEHQKRVVEERADLAGKISRLQRFLEGTVFNGLPAEEQGNLTEQLDHMQKYDAVLARRIAAFAESAA